MEWAGPITAWDLTALEFKSHSEGERLKKEQKYKMTSKRRDEPTQLTALACQIFVSQEMLLLLLST